MMWTMQCRGYTGSINYSAADWVYYGRVLGIEGLISYEGKTITKLRQDFIGAIDDYLDMCAEQKIRPEVPSK